MDTVHFLGYVLPEGVNISVGHRPTLKWDAPELGVSMEFVISITNSKIDAECKITPRYRPELLSNLRMRALDLCRASVNLVAMKHGFGLITILDKFVDPSGAVMVVHVQNPALAALCTAFDLGKGFDEVHLLVLEDVHISVVLNDLISGLNATHTTQIASARVLDALKNRIAIPGSGNAWQQMRDTLNLSEAYMKFITDHSKDPRHGKLPIISEADAEEISRRSWTVMNRYLEYLKKGKTRLSLADFPLL